MILLKHFYLFQSDFLEKRKPPLQENCTQKDLAVYVLYAFKLPNIIFYISFFLRVRVRGGRGEKLQGWICCVAKMQRILVLCNKSTQIFYFQKKVEAFSTQVNFFYLSTFFQITKYFFVNQEFFFFDENILQRQTESDIILERVKAMKAV